MGSKSTSLSTSLLSLSIIKGAKVPENRDVVNGVCLLILMLLFNAVVGSFLSESDCLWSTDRGVEFNTSDVLDGWELPSKNNPLFSTF